MNNSKENKTKKKHRFWKVLLTIIIILLIIRILLPYVLLSYANRTLNELEGYRGHIEDIDLALIRGAYTIDNIYLDLVDSITNKQTPFMSSDRIDLAVKWDALFKGKISGEIDLLNPAIIFTREKVDPEKLKDDTVNFRIILKRLMPLKINRFEMINGLIEFNDSTSKPVVNLKMDSIHVTAYNLSNQNDTALLPASVNASANVYGGKLNLQLKLNPLSKNPAFDLNVELTNTDLKELNPFFKAYANIDVNKGNFGMYAEVAGRDNKYVGYVKPIIKDLDVKGPEDKNDRFLNKIWESVIQAAGNILKNKKEEQVATKIPISGDYNETSVKVWYTVMSVLRNAFIQAIYPSIDFQINQSTVKNLRKEDKENILEKILNKDNDKTRKEKKEERKERRKEKKEEDRKSETKK